MLVSLFSLPPTQTYDIDLHIVGENWDAANAEAEKLLAKEPHAVFIHPFEKVSLKLYL